jgi:hypothetical protein
MVTATTCDASIVRCDPVGGVADRLDELNAISTTSTEVRRRTPNTIQKMIDTRHLLRFFEQR